jgi:hypothetical protein
MYLPLNKFLRRFNMIGLLKKLFGAKPAETTAEVPYKVEAAPANVQAEGVVEAPAASAVVVVPEAVAPAAVVEQASAKKPAPKKPQAAKKPVAPKTATPKTAPKPKAKPAA